MKVYRAKKGELIEVTGEEVGVFANGDAYLVDAGMNIYIWLGEKCSVDEKFLSARSASILDAERAGKAKITTFHQGEESQEFLDNFGGKIELIAEDTPTLFKPVEVEEYAAKMYHVRREPGTTMDKTEVKLLDTPSKSVLHSNDVYIVDGWEEIYVWQGKSANVAEKVTASRVARSISGRRGRGRVVVVTEGDEPSEFFGLLD